MKMLLRRWLEVFMIRVARRIIMGRNVHRCTVVSRRDNNEMWYMGEKLDAICECMMDEYENIDGDY